MSPEAQKIAICKVTGWELIHNWHGPTSSFNGAMETGSAWRNKAAQDDFYCFDGVSFHHFPPDYLNDLNAMHEAENILTDEQFLKYGWILLAREHNIQCRSYLSATAAQRAEAFLKCLGLYVEETK